MGKIKLINLIIPLIFIILVCTCGNDEEIDWNSVPTTLNILFAPNQEPVEALVDKVIVLVEGGNIEEPIEQELKIDGAYATGLLKVPPGEVQFIINAFAGEQLVYEGYENVTIETGRKVTVNVELHPVGEMVLIPAGEFEMGDNFNEGRDEELPVHTVYLDAFLIDKYEVTVGQYKKFIQATGHRNPDWWDVVSEFSPTDEHPIILVSWHEAVAYAEWVGKRLPTEAEWEKAARGGLVGKRYPRGDEISHNDANYDGTEGRDIWDESTSPVGSFAPNGYGLYDTAGNVIEWCSDWYDANYYANSPKNNPKGPNSGLERVVRGGAWFVDPVFLRCAFRHGIDPSDYFYGFRCAQDP